MLQTKILKIKIQQVLSEKPEFINKIEQKKILAHLLTDSIFLFSLTFFISFW